MRQSNRVKSLIRDTDGLTEIGAVALTGSVRDSYSDGRRPRAGLWTESAGLTSLACQSGAPTAGHRRRRLVRPGPDAEGTGTRSPKTHSDSSGGRHIDIPDRPRGVSSRDRRARRSATGRDGARPNAGRLDGRGRTPR